MGRADSLQDTRQDTQSQALTGRGSWSWRKCPRGGRGQQRAGPGEEAASGQLPDRAARTLDGVELDMDPRRTTRGTRPQRGGPREECPPHEPRGSLAGAEASEQTVHSQAGTEFSPGDEEEPPCGSKQAGPEVHPTPCPAAAQGQTLVLPCLHPSLPVYTLVSLSTPSLPVYTLVSPVYT